MPSPKAAARHGEEASSASAAPEGSYPIGTLASEAGVSTRTIRYYEEIGLLKTARRFAGGRRVFPSDALERLRFIGRLKRLGFSLEEISELNDVFEMGGSTTAMLGVLDQQLESHMNTIDEQLAELSTLRNDLNHYRERIGGRLGQLDGK